MCGGFLTYATKMEEVSIKIVNKPTLYCAVAVYLFSSSFPVLPSPNNELGITGLQKAVLKSGASLKTP